MGARFRLVQAAMSIAEYKVLEERAARMDLSVNDMAEQMLSALASEPTAAAPVEIPPAPPQPAPPQPPAPPAPPIGKPEAVPEISDAQLATARRLKASRFDTADIARLLKVSKASVVKALGRK